MQQILKNSIVMERTYCELAPDQKETWFLLDQAIRKMVVISQLESDLDNYRKLKEEYQ